MKQSGHLNPSEETGTGWPVSSKYGSTPPNKHGGEGRQQQQVISKSDKSFRVQIRNREEHISIGSLKPAHLKSENPPPVAHTPRRV